MPGRLYHVLHGCGGEAPLTLAGKTEAACLMYAVPHILSARSSSVSDGFTASHHYHLCGDAYRYLLRSLAAYRQTDGGVDTSMILLRKACG